MMIAELASFNTRGRFGPRKRGRSIEAAHLKGRLNSIRLVWLDARPVSFLATFLLCETFDGSSKSLL